MNILIIEDEMKLATTLGEAFASEGLQAFLAHDVATGIQQSMREDIDLVILDLGLPDRPGMDVLRSIRARDPRLPVLILTARDSVGDRVAGLDGGADDYLIKPFAFNELLARVRAVLRRGKAAETVLRIADLSIDLVRRSATRGGRSIVLTPTEFSLLSVLMGSAGDPVSRKTLSERIWDIHFDSQTNVVEVSMRRLRMKVDDPFPTKLIHTIRGVGYVCADSPLDARG